MFKNKYDFMFFIQAKDCNPNGDPDMGNTPRIDEETMQGYITDVAVKRKIRDYIECAYPDTAGMNIIIKDATNLDRSIAEIIVNSKVGENPVTKACEGYYDVRTFGAVLSTGGNAGQIKGPVQFEFGKSLDPVFPKDISITRICYAQSLSDKESLDLNEFDKEDAKMDPRKKRGMGRKQFIPYGLYKVNGYVSAGIANKTGFSEKDLEILFESILNMYEYSSSATKAGMSVVSPIIIFKHVGVPDPAIPEKQIRQSILGCAPAYKLQELVKIKKKSNIEFPRNYTDYDISIDISNLPRGVEVGFKYLPFEDIVWGAPTDKWISVM